MVIFLQKQFSLELKVRPFRVMNDVMLHARRLILSLATGTSGKRKHARRDLSLTHNDVRNTKPLQMLDCPSSKHLAQLAA